jgi:DNA-binding LacI/PurR family transcriptional regulator
MANRRPTIFDVAEHAGVSPTTVSHALNEKGRVDAATRERVRNAATSLGYHASPAARGLRTGRTSTIGMMLPHAESVVGTEDFFGLDFYLDLAVGAAQAAFAQRHALTLLPDVVTSAELGQFPLDGVIVNDPVRGDPRLVALDELGVPYVTVERALDRPEHRRWVAADTTAGTHAALDQLADAGAERIALLSWRLSWAWLVETEQAYASWCEGRGREPVIVDLGTKNSREPVLPELPERVLGGPGSADAIFTASDRYAVAVARAIAERGLRVGEDVLLACGVDSRVAAEHSPPITALYLHPERLAKAAVELMLSGDEGPRVLEPELRVRASSGRAR